MLKQVEVKNARATSIQLEYTLFAFQTRKGVFTLVGSQSNGIDTFKQLNIGEYHEWSRETVYNWWKLGKIEPVKEATRLDWYTTTQMPLKSIKNKK